MRSDNAPPSGSCHLSEVQQQSATALKESMQKGRFVAYYTHPYRLPLSQSAAVRAPEKLPRDEATIAPGDFSFLPYPTYCGLTTVDKVLYKHCLSLDIPS
ncbi:uncharacterized protein Tco025E_00239 [Trypanosoma conorhini]|uniref:Uncharacterized protein n=1 Tax=Trypanosoma conorhini TaxID=83891 RepID=A0A3R7LFQ0_9TRYP|nr:uncharacterized protein Tco025E_00239 [Trypanosoma conorhini]RNF27503.1 hypothetical protein Tco025E_00239 [Trypanosoma conorhini]